ncbi:IPT/TIG domain-containing protein [Mycetocola miduiensis]|uniref:IPT/TIG domain-containing protein n=1 Tax=Mycetocola miduiensis TaxID=995034 RepID=A0A1I5AUL4_9MICO|nr:IPT/TIG domain-containing protein [Mycetocola miduiensis]SFN66127.1 IPT/TIG domain-containing protein [Mycetocola miduiensis]
MADHSLYNTTTPSAGSLALAHQKILRVKLNGAWVNTTGDINNLAGNPTPIEINREVYGTKGRQSKDVIGYNFAPSFSVEGVRDPVTKKIVAAQAWLVDLIKAAYSEGEDNKREFQWFDALDEDLPAFEGKFSIAVSDLNTGFADKGGWTFTLTNDGVVDRIVSPIAGTGIPILESATPAGQSVGDLIVVRGYGLASAVSATIGGEPVTELRIVDNYAAVIQIPAAVAGSAPIIVTNAAGASLALPYNAA